MKAVSQTFGYQGIWGGAAQQGTGVRHTYPPCRKSVISFSRTEEIFGLFWKFH